MASDSSSRRGGIDHEQVRRAERLLAAGWAKAAIARHLGISRQSVYRIHWGTHRLQRKRAIRRCRGCGNVVEHPCRVCAARKEARG